MVPRLPIRLVLALALAAPSASWAAPAAPPAPAISPRPPALAAAAPPVTTVLLDDFRKLFEADAGKVRLVLLFSPT